MREIYLDIGKLMDGSDSSQYVGKEYKERTIQEEKMKILCLMLLNIPHQILQHRLTLP